MTEAKLSKITLEILRQMYEEATPPALYPDGVDTYEDHYLSSDRQSDIINEVCKLRRVGPSDKKRIEFSIHTGDCPNTTPIFKHHE